MDQETLNLINKYRQYNPEYEKYTDQEIIQLGLPGLNQSDNTQDGNKFNLMDYLPFGNKSISDSIMRGIGNFVPERDPRQTALNEFYDVNNGTVQSGLMAGYNPVSGGFLNTVTGGKFGDPTKYGLQDAYQKRIDTINKTLQRKYTDKGLSFNNTELDERRDKLIADMNNESNAMSGGGDGTFGLGTQGQKSYSNPGDSFGTNAITGGPVSNKTGSGRTDYMEGGRAGYFFGGRVNYKAGGRIGFRGGGMDMGNEENQAQSAAMGNTTVSNNNDGGNDNPPNFFVKDKTSIIDTSGLKSKSPEINIDYTDPRNYASLKSKIYNKNILDNDDINVDGTLSGKIGPVSYNTNFTDQGITGTNLKAGNFNAGIDANKNYRLGYANNYNNINYGTTYDSNGNLMFTAGVNFKNGGLAGLL